ncbi:glutamate decarboxylase [Musa troglodytarum]|uniref:Glutamate decarboxylase n=1 Tax=Musa troglodytarum TaxID=320322 RepID=A0A9E7H177_9LILI|nr:glutamate decarboxylase [Musa troglodytarum]
MIHSATKASDRSIFFIIPSPPLVTPSTRRRRSHAHRETYHVWFHSPPRKPTDGLVATAR